MRGRPHGRRPGIEDRDAERLEHRAHELDVGAAHGRVGRIGGARLLENLRVHRGARCAHERCEERADVAERNATDARPLGCRRLERQGLEPTANRDVGDASFGEVGVVGRRPEERRRRDAGGVLERIGDRERGERLVPGEDGAAEESRLLPRRDHDAALPGDAPQPLGGRTARRERGRERVQPVGRVRRANALDVRTPLGRIRRARREPGRARAIEQGPGDPAAA